MSDPMQKKLLENLENRTLQDLIQDRRLSLSSHLSPLRPGDLYFIDISQDDISYRDYRGWTASFSSSTTLDTPEEPPYRFTGDIE